MPKEDGNTKKESLNSTVSNYNYKTTADIKLDKSTINQVIGQEKAVNIIKKAAAQRRHVFLIGEPGTGKSMLGAAMAELLPKEKLKDILCFRNPDDENTPLVRTVNVGEGRNIVARSKMSTQNSMKNQNIILLIIIIAATLLPYYFWKKGEISDVIYAASMISSMGLIIGFIIFLNLSKKMNVKMDSPKIIVDNFGKKHAPFFDASGAHAGALLGDVLHDPYQSLNSSDKISIIDDKNNVKSITVNELIDGLMLKNKNNILVQSKNNYEAIYLEKKELNVFGEINGNISSVEVLSCNRYDYLGDMIKIITSDNKELIVTPEHKIAVLNDKKIEYVMAKDIKKDMNLLCSKEDIIIDEQDIIDTYDEEQKEQCRLYYEYLRLKKENPLWGYKRIAKAMNQDYGKTRWWHAKKHLPYPIQTCNWLKDKGLLPLKTNNPNLNIISKILGATFGDGGIFENLNGIFLSSSEYDSITEFKHDIEKLFILSDMENARIIEGGEYGHSWCYQQTNRNIIRFFLALGAPKGNKTKIDFCVPKWIYFNHEVKTEFFASLFGSEIGIPKIHVSHKQLNTFDFSITAKHPNKNSRESFVNEIKIYLSSQNVNTGNIIVKEIISPKSNKPIILVRLLFSTKFDSLISFAKNCRINYSNFKKHKLTKTINTFSMIKKIKYQELISRGYGAEQAMNLLNLSQKSLYEILNDTHFVVKEKIENSYV